MLKKKLGIWIGTLLLLLSVAACAQTEEGQTVEVGENTSIENKYDTPSEGDDPTEGNDTTVKDDPVDTFMHIHGLSYDKKEPFNLFMSTHHGLIQIDAANEWNWVGESKNRHDLMGFTVQNKDTMISSGHPAEGSKLKNPLGVVISKDQGETWEPISLHGKVDFHVFEVNAGDPSVLYGTYAHGAQAGFYQSLDGGSNWEKIKTEGLPKDLSIIYSVVSNPEDPQSILVGAQNGILASTDGGKTWALKSKSQTFTSIKGAIHPSGRIVAYLLGENEGLMTSNDFGATWTSLNLILKDDAAMHIAIHPNQEGVYVVGTHKEHVLQTIDGGETWTNLAESGKPVK
jgi:photosystem II stability/assembly factor-like uncharacterized protein